MPKEKITYNAYIKETLDMMTSMGLLLVSVDKECRPNAMTIGWGVIGSIWGRPMFCVLVRPSRHTYNLIEVTDDFTVNVPTKELSTAVEFCGTKSGRDYDKFRETRLTPVASHSVRSPVIEECPLQYECKVVHKNYIIPGKLIQEIVQGAYPNGDFHTVYFGEIVGVYADPDVRQKLLSVEEQTA